MKEVLMNTFIAKTKAGMLALLCSLFLFSCANSAPRVPTAYSLSAVEICPAHLQKLCEAYNIVQKKYATRIPDKEMTDMFIRGFMKELNEEMSDPYSKYLPAQSTSNESAVRPTSYGGVGLVLSKDDAPPHDLVIQMVFPSTPAFDAKLRRGDRITRIDNVPVKEKTLMETTDLIRSETGTKVKLSISRACEGSSFDVSLVTRPIKSTSGFARMIDASYAYVYISSFEGGEYAAQKTRHSLKNLLAKRGVIDGLIIDLRSNPGGRITQARDLVSLFAEQGTVFYEKFQDDREVPWGVLPNSKDMLSGAPIVVLVDEGTASSSEIVAGALQDMKRAAILGTQTYKKGVLQDEYEMKDGSGLYLTIAYSFTPRHSLIHKVGITPDVTVKTGKNESCTGDLQLQAALALLRQENKHRNIVARR